jgi:hypothetical protein
VGNPEASSGFGSSMASTEKLRRELPPLLWRFGIRSMFDAGWSDCHWVSSMDHQLDLYIRADIVAALMKSNRERAWDGRQFRREFITLDIVKDRIPTVDLIFCPALFDSSRLARHTSLSGELSNKRFEIRVDHNHPQLPL